MISSMSLNGGSSGRVERHRGAETQELSGWEVGEKGMKALDKMVFVRAVGQQE